MPARLLETVKDGRVQLVMSLSLHKELEDVVYRDRLAERIARRGETPAHLLATILAVVEMVTPVPLQPPADLRDPDDLAVLECAVAAQAEAIVTGDKDLLVLKEYAGIPILTVRAALEKLGIATG